MATPATNIYYTVSPAASGPSNDTLCEKTWIVAVYTDSSGKDNLLFANYAYGYFDLYADYVEPATNIAIRTLPAIVQTWLTQYAYDPTNFSVFK